MERAKSWSRQRVDLTGQRFTNLVVTGKAPTTNRRTKWACRCDCGKVRVASTQGLRLGHTKCCGCGISGRRRYFSERPREARIYGIWRGMLSRCNDDRNPCFDDYGGRGIRVCEEWATYDAFYDWALANGYQDDLSIDRIDNDGGYGPTNCRWATPAEQARNKRTNVYLIVGRETMTLSDACRRFGIGIETVRQRIIRGWPDQALFSPVEEITLVR